MFVLFDIGGTNTRVALSKDRQGFDDPIIEKTNHHPSQGPLHFINLIEKLAGNKNIRGVVGGIAGTLNQEKNKLIHAPNLKSWEHYPLAATLSSHFSCPVFLENDTALVGLGEAHHGAGAGYDIMTYITVSTGVGGVKITNGMIDESTFGFEPGHHIVDWKTKTTLEMLVSGTANAEKYKTNIIDIPQQAWQELAEQLAIGIYNSNLFWSSAGIILGGSMITKKISIDIEAVITAFEKLPQVFNGKPDIKQATLGDFGGLYGALHLSKNI